MLFSLSINPPTIPPSTIVTTTTVIANKTLSTQSFTPISPFSSLMSLWLTTNHHTIIPLPPHHSYDNDRHRQQDPINPLIHTSFSLSSLMTNHHTPTPLPFYHSYDNDRHRQQDPRIDMNPSRVYFDDSEVDLDRHLVHIDNTAHTIRRAYDNLVVATQVRPPSLSSSFSFVSCTLTTPLIPYDELMIIWWWLLRLDLPPPPPAPLPPPLAPLAPLPFSFSYTHPSTVITIHTGGEREIPPALLHHWKGPSSYLGRQGGTPPVPGREGSCRDR